MGEVVRERRFVLLFALAGALASALFLGAADRSAADTVSGCAGKPLCVSITDQAQASRTPSGGPDHYLTDTVVVSNDGTSSNLVNLTLTITWNDVGAPTTTEYRPAFSDTRCTLSQTLANTIDCALPKSLRPGTSETFSLVFRTATNDAATAFNLTAKATAKEQEKAKGGAPPNDAVVERSNSTTYEGNPDQDVSIGGGGISTTLATSSTVGLQFSKLPIPAAADRALFDILETNCASGDATCVGQQITTTAPGIEPVNLQITYTGPVPSGLNENGVVVLHTREGDTEPTVIDERCSGDLFSGTVDPDEIPCRRVDITKLSNTISKVEIDAWDLQNGDWKWG